MSCKTGHRRSLNIEKPLCHKSVSFLCSWFSSLGSTLNHRTHTRNTHFLIKETGSDSNSCSIHYPLRKTTLVERFTRLWGAGREMCIFPRGRASFVFLDLSYCNINSFWCLAWTSWEFTEVTNSQDQSMPWWLPFLQVKHQRVTKGAYSTRKHLQASKILLSLFLFFFFFLFAF